jgi:catechol 2,3-dioxygenase-like lactoylglutathione lyase family enzyme
MKVRGLDHLVLTVRDIEKTLSSYKSVLGMEPVRFGEGRVALKFGKQKIDLHQADKEIEPTSGKPTPGSADLCFLTSMKPKDAMDHVLKEGVEIIEGPVKRTGANGSIISFYFRDPDLNLIEVASEGYVT